MRTWRLDAQRSLRRLATAQVREASTMRGAKWEWVHAREWLWSPGWRGALAVTLALSVPLDLYIGHDAASWLGGAWQISAVLLGFVVALVVFLLQAAGGQSLRAEPAFRALIAASGVIWPVAFVVVFLVQTGIIERYSNVKSPPPGWVDTWALAFFALQVAAFGMVFVRLLALVSPSGVAKVMSRALAVGIRRSVQERLVAARARELMSSRSKQFGIEGGHVAGAGRPVPADRTGFVEDIDLRLPQRVHAAGASDHIQSLPADLGVRVVKARGIARIDVSAAATTADLIRNAVRIRRHRRVSADWVDLFREAVDMSRRALNEGAIRGFETALDVTVGGFEQLPRAYRLYGREYDVATASQVVVFTEENALATELRRLTRDVFASGSSDASMRMPSVAYRIFRAGLDERAPYLTAQALELWKFQLVAARTITEPATLRGVVDDIASLTGWLVNDLTQELKDDACPMPDGVEAAQCLVELFRFETELYKSHAEANDPGSFQAVWDRFTYWEQTWDPEREFDAVQMQLAAATDPAEEDELRAARVTAAAVVGLYNELVQFRDESRFILGAWLAWRYRNDNLPQEIWDRFHGYFDEPYRSHAAPDRWLDRVMEVGGPSSRLDQWETSTWEVRAPTARYGPNGSTIAVFWATILLLRRSQPDNAPDLTAVAVIEGVAQDLVANIQAIEENAGKWSSLVGVNVAAKAAALRSSIGHAVAQAQAAAAARVAAAPLRDERKREYADTSWRAFVQNNRLRRRLDQASALETSTQDGAFGRPKFGARLDKRLFVERAANFIGVDEEALAREAAADEQRSIYEALAALAGEAPAVGTPAERGVAAIQQMRAVGLEPDVVLVPNDYRIKPRLGGNPDFSWSRGPAADELGFLAGVPVLNVGPQDGSYLVVANLAHAIRVRELLAPGMETPLRVDTRPIDRPRAEEFIAEYGMAPGAEHENVVELLLGQVEAFVDLELRIAKSPDWQSGAVLRARIR